MSDDQHQFKDRYMLRLPDGMRDRIKAAAEANNRSMNAEIIDRLEASFVGIGNRDERLEKLEASFAVLSRSLAAMEKTLGETVALLPDKED